MCDRIYQWVIISIGEKHKSAHVVLSYRNHWVIKRHLSSSYMFLIRPMVGYGTSGVYDAGRG